MSYQNAPTALFRLDSSLTLPQARGKLVSALLRSYSTPELAQRLRRLRPDATIPAGASSRSLASKIAWALLPGGRGA